MNSKTNNISLLDVLRHLDVEALGSMFGEHDLWEHSIFGASPFRGASLSCRALYEIVDSSITRARMSPRLLATWRPGQQSLLTRFRRCTHLSLRLSAGCEESSDDDEDEDDEPQQPQPLLAALCFSGMEPAAAAGITHLRLTSSELQLRALAGHAIAVAGWLRNVRELQLETDVYCEERPGKNRAVYTALRAALPRLEVLVLPGVGFLAGLEAFAGSGLTTVRVAHPWKQGGALLIQHVRSLQQLTQISNLEINISDGGFADPDHALYPAAAGEAALPGCEDDDATLAGMDKRAAQQLHSLRQLLAAPPPGVRSFKIVETILTSSLRSDPMFDERLSARGEGIAFSFEDGGRLAAVDLGVMDGVDGMNYLAAALLPRLLLAPPGSQRLPLLQIQCISDTAARFRSFLQPQRPLARLLALCDRVEVASIDVNGEPPDEDTAAALCAAVQLFGWPEDVSYCAISLGLTCTLERVRAGDTAASRGGGGNGRSQQTTVGELGAPWPPPVPADVTAAQVVQWAADLMWSKAAGEQDSRTWQQSTNGILLLRGPLVRQLAVGPGGAARLRAWLDAWVEEATSVAPSLARQHVDAEAGSTGTGGAAAAEVARGTCIRSCKVAAAAATAVVWCNGLPRLCAAIAAAGAVLPGSLEALRFWSEWCAFINWAVQQLWDSQQAAADPAGGPDMATAAAAFSGGSGHHHHHHHHPQQQ